MRRSLVVALAVIVSGTLTPLSADPIEPPLPEPGLLGPVAAGACLPSTPYESHVWYWNQVGACKRVKFHYGPIVVRPGQNDVLLGPITIEKPAYDGYWTRFKPDLVDATGQPPSINDVHLHHANWLTGRYGIMLATGEEKTLVTWPEGYGVLTPVNDPWVFLYMVHNTGIAPMTVYITWEMDFIASPDAEALGIKPVRPIWLDVQAGRKFHETQPDSSSNPVFNVERGFGTAVDAETGLSVCSWPSQNCSRHDVYGDVTAQQGLEVAGIAGTDRDAPEDGVIIGLGGHLHPGGIRDEVSLVRDGVEKPIFISDAVYWNRKYPDWAGRVPGDPSARNAAPPNSWDFSMTVTGASLGWKVAIRETDTIRLRAVQENGASSWYENMGIVMAYYARTDHAPDADACAAGDLKHCPAIDVFDDDVDVHTGLPTTALWPPGFGADWAQPPGSCTPDPIGADGRRDLCLRGQVTHGHLDEAGDFGGCPPSGCPEITAERGPRVSDIAIAGFLNGAADMGVIGTNGLPWIAAGDTLRFWNIDAGVDIWHTITSCAAPCTGATGLDYPLADGTGPDGSPVDFDSGEIGYGVQFSPAKSHIDRGDWSPQKKIENGLFWDFDSSGVGPGVYTFWCRVHPFMRGAFEVVDVAAA